MMKTEICIATVVVTYNRSVLLQETIRSLLEQSFNIDKIILVNNCSTDNTESLLQDNGYLDHPIVDYLKLEENTGGAGGFYTGLKHLQDNYNFEYVWMMDDDAEPENKCLEVILKAMNETNADVGSCIVKNLDGSIDIFHRGEIINTVKTIEHLPHSLIEGDQEVDFISFVGPLYKKEVIDKVGLPNKDFFIHNDDFDYSIRIKKLKFKSILTFETFILHKQESTIFAQDNSLNKRFNRISPPRHTNNILRFKFSLYAFRNMIYLIRRECGLLPAIIYSFNFFSKEIIKLVVYNEIKLIFLKIYLKCAISALTGKLGKI
ncbi:glycosyltransferase [Acinetobacter sp. TYF_19]|uniref:glycosyltransferase n=1 Tax=Acinetobacter sp. TYF_19 TaxID=3367196 RepID=UPI00370CA55C